jgi:hypothetical protein
MATWRPDIWGAFAGGIGAVASAVIAAVTLSFLSSQEKATYLSNLYNKQVDTLANLEVAYFEYANLLFDDHLVLPTRQEIGDIAAFQQHLIARESDYRRADYKITNARLAAAVVAPQKLQELIGLPEGAAAHFFEAIKEFERQKPTEENLETFLRIIDDINQTEVEDWDEYLFRDEVGYGQKWDRAER